jgi:hypothetical protein
MKKLLLLSVPIILSACGGGSPAPTTTAPGSATIGGGTALSYPYNPSMNGSEYSDARVPYYGEWSWAVTFSTGDTFVGRMSISKRISPVTTFTNAGGGAGVWCVNGDNCAYGNDLGVVGTATSGRSYLFGSLFDNSSYQQVKFVGLDSDGVVGTEVQGLPTLSGTGQWQYYSGGSANIGFAMVQTSTNPPVKLASVTPSGGNVIKSINAANSGLKTQAVADLQKRALDVLKKTF